MFLQAKIILHGKNSDEILKGLNRNLGNGMAKVKKRPGGAECVFDECDEARKAVNKTVREYVVRFVEPLEIKRIINRVYSFFEPFEKKKLINAVQQAIDGEEDIHDQLFVMRRNRIIESVSESYFKENSSLNLDGFVPFRLQSYCDELENLVEYNAEAYIVKKEYAEFVYLLKNYLLEQPSLMRKIDVAVTENRQYIFFDGMGRDISHKLCREMFSEFEVGSDDMLVNVLITKNPEKIVIHNRRFMKKEIADTLKLIFDDRCSFCEECNLCKKNHSINN